MKGITHLIAGIVIDYTIIHIFNNVIDTNYIISLGGAIIGSLLPDIDSENSIISKKFPVISQVIRLFINH